MDCPAGWWCSAGFSTPCEPGFYNPDVNKDDAGDCQACPQEDATSPEAATSPSECRCLAGEFMDAPNDRSSPLQWECVSCDETSGDITCEDNGLFIEDIVVKSGFWRPHARSTVVKPCPGVGVGCAGGAGLSEVCRYRADSTGYPPERETGDNCTRETATCDAGHGGVYCSTCIDGWYKESDGACEVCAASEGSAAAIALMVVAGLVLTVLLLYWCGWGAAAVQVRALGPRGTDDDIVRGET